MSSLRYRAWCFTVNNHTFDDLIGILDLSFVYLCFGFEIAPTTGTPHIQGYIYMHDAHTLSAMSKKIRRASFIASKGTVKQNQEYTCKPGNEDNWYEFGEPPQQGSAKWDKIEEVMKDPRSNPHLYNQYNKMYRALTLSTPKDHEREVRLISGHNRLKKAKYHLDQGEKVQIRYCEDTYDGETIVFCSCFTEIRIDEWINGFPPKERRGYEIICIDPRIVYLVYDDPGELQYFLKKYPEYIDLDGKCEKIYGTSSDESD